MKSKTGDLSGRFIPKGSEDELRTFHRRLADLNRERLSRARAEGRTHVVVLGGEHVYRDPDTGRLVLASEAPQQAFVHGWELIGHQVHEEHRPAGNYDRAITDGARRSRVQRLRRTTATRGTGRAPRQATNAHTRGSRRGERATSSSSDDPEPEPPAAKPCANGCGRPRRPKLQPPDRYYCSKECRLEEQRARQNRKRGRDRENPDRVVERTSRPTTGRVRCRCGSHAAYALDHRWVCVPCGRPIAGAYSDVNGHLADFDVLEVLAEETRRGAHTPWVSREWKTRPKRDLSNALRRRDRERGYRFDAVKRDS